MRGDIKEALEYIPCADLDREQWIEVGMALQAAGEDCSVWEEWSRADSSRFREGECQKKWEGFSPDGGIGPGTIFMMAKGKGYRPVETYDWDTELPAEKEPPAQMLIRYLETLFLPDEYVGYVTESYERDGKYIPANKGIYHHTCKELVSELKKYPDDIGAAIGDYDQKAGAWIKPNPLDGKGVNDANVTDFRYTLVESDKLSIEEQYKAYRELELPIAALVYSGGKSLHAIVKIEAANKTEYKERVTYLHNVLKSRKISVDKQNKNASRLSRMPGVTRNGQLQELRAVNIGKKSFDEWKVWIEDDLPPIRSLKDELFNPPPLDPEMIHGLLRRSHRGIISAPSKAGKSMLCIELAIALATGTEWLGFQCEQGNVLYLNFEIAHPSFVKRINDVLDRLERIGRPVDRKAVSENIEIWPLRGYAAPLDQLTAKIIERAKNREYICIILDPLYKVGIGDENSAEFTTKLMNEITALAEKLNAAVFTCHHFSKGTQGGKKAIDRASGSGVYGRDPDCIMVMSELEMSNEVLLNVRDGKQIPYRIEFALREFDTPKPVQVWYEYPLHVVDETGELAKLHINGEQMTEDQKESQQMYKRQKIITKMIEAYDSLGKEWVSQSAIEHAGGPTRGTIRSYKKAGYLDEWFDFSDTGAMRRKRSPDQTW